MPEKGGKRQIGRPFVKGEHTVGRKPGTPNKVTRTTKENIERVYEALGGWEGMKKWAESSRQNATIFYSEIYPKLLPLDIKHSGSMSTVLKFDFGNNGQGDSE